MEEINMNQIVSTHNLSKRYGNTYRVKDVNLSVCEGDIYGFLGPNGAGKSTTLKMILGLTRPTDGKVTVFGKDLGVNRSLILSQTGSLIESPSYYGHLTGLENMRVIQRLRDVPDKNVSESLKIVRLDNQKDKKVEQYSLGMKQRLGIAMGLLSFPKLLILDEATSGLDPIVRDEILDIFLEFIQNEEHTIFISSHITSDLEKVADYITFIHDGKIILSESKDNLTDNYGVVKCKKEDFEKLDRNHIIGIRKNKFGYEVMIDNKREIIKQMNQKKYSNEFYLDNTTIEEIILFKVRGE